jgi:hypothetical protein
MQQLSGRFAASVAFWRSTDGRITRPCNIHRASPRRAKRPTEGGFSFAVEARCRFRGGCSAAKKYFSLAA